MTIYSLPTLTEAAKLPPHSVIALGFFDGVHLGHRSIIDTARRAAEETGSDIAVWMISAGDKSFKQGSLELTGEMEKFSLLERAGAKYAAVYDFSEIRDKDGESFVREILRDELDAAAVVCGFNFRFGKGATCDVDDLRYLCEKYGIDTVIAPAVTDETGENISSTRIRALLTDGEVTKAALMLGRPYSFTSVVIHGKMLGRTLGFPTANQLIPQRRLTPRRGVYAVAVEFEENGKFTAYAGAANIGFCPTVTEEALKEAGVPPHRLRLDGAAANGHAVCETYIAGYSGDLYGKLVTIRFLRRLRGEQKFNGIDELTKQIRTDAECAVKIYNEVYGSLKYERV